MKAAKTFFEKQKSLEPELLNLLNKTQKRLLSKTPTRLDIKEGKKLTDEEFQEIQKLISKHFIEEDGDYKEI